jgi:hypothetical protein
MVRFHVFAASGLRVTAPGACPSPARASLDPDLLQVADKSDLVVEARFALTPPDCVEQLFVLSLQVGYSGFRPITWSAPHGSCSPLWSA